jgi:spore coat polysaccharide biosynthesis protein SpsF
MKIVTVIQARTLSTRFPGKVLKLLAGEPVLIRMVERVKASKLSGNIVVATTTNKADDEIEEICMEENINCFRGDPLDLLDRHYKTGLKFGADAVVKIPSDCPLIDPKIIDKVISYYIANSDRYNYVSNLHPPSYPDGNDVEVIQMSTLFTAWKEANKDFEREHTTPFIWERPERFRIGNVQWETGVDFSMIHRWTLDYPEDYLFIKSVYDNLYYHHPHFGLYDILNLLYDKPELKMINKKFNGVNWYRHHLDRLKTIKPHQTKVLAEK